MANIKAKTKSRTQDDKREFRNKSKKSEIKTAIKKANTEKTKISINHAVKLIDSSITSGVYHTNKAARLKSKIHKIETSK